MILKARGGGFADGYIGTRGMCEGIPLAVDGIPLTADEDATHGRHNLFSRKVGVILTVDENGSHDTWEWKSRSVLRIS